MKVQAPSDPFAPSYLGSSDSAVLVGRGLCRECFLSERNITQEDFFLGSVHSQVARSGKSLREKQGAPRSVKRLPISPGPSVLSLEMYSFLDYLPVNSDVQEDSVSRCMCIPAHTSPPIHAALVCTVHMPPGRQCGHTDRHTFSLDCFPSFYKLHAASYKMSFMSPKPSMLYQQTHGDGSSVSSLEKHKQGLDVDLS